jgi:RecA/RadA recombinase
MTTATNEKKKKVVRTSVLDLDALRKELKSTLVDVNDNYDFFLTGNPIFDAFVGSGGLPKYQLEYIWAQPSVGKSTLAIQILASYLKQVPPNKPAIVIYFDTEESITPNRLRSLWIDDVTKIIISNPETVEQVGEILNSLRARFKDVETFVIWDTIAQTPTTEELNGYGKIGMQARALTSLFRNTKFFDSQLTMIALNQYRETNFEANAKYMPKEPPGGNATKHKSFCTLYGTKKKSELVEPDFGFTATFKTQKSKIISPGRQFPFEVTNISGCDSVLSAIGFLRTMKLLGKKNGGYFYFVDDESNSWRLPDLYKWFLTAEAIPRWKMVIDEMYNALYPDDDQQFIAEAKARIINYYFKDNKVHIDRFTSLNRKMMNTSEDVSISKEADGILDKVSSFIDNSVDDDEEQELDAE